MDWQALHAKLALHHAAAPQRAKLAELALREVEQAVGALARLGHVFHLTEVFETSPVEWPKMVYHGTLPAAVVSSQEELDLLGEGWHLHPSLGVAAQHLAPPVE